MRRPLIYSRRMPPVSRTRGRLALSRALAAVALGLLASCGGQDQGRPIPAATARDIAARLDEVGRRVDAEACNDIREDSLPALRRQVDGLPERVDDQVKTTLDDGIGHLEELVDSECRQRTRRRRSRSTPTVTPTPQPQTPTQTQPQQTPTQPQTPQQPDTGNSGNDSSGDDSGSGGGSGGDDAGGGSSDGGGGSTPDGGSGSLPGGGGQPGTVGGGTST
jgi:hypothetical protein